MPPSNSQRKPQKREIELDFIRGIAILMVLDYHSPRSLLLAPFTLLGFHNFGWSGVDIFFVLSGFLVGGLLVREWELHGRVDSKRFLIRRGFKIWPQYYFFLCAILLTRHRPIRELWGNLLNIQNYVGGVAHTWTLAVEEHAYLLLLALFAVAPRFRANMKHLLYGVGTVCVLIVIWRFTLSYHGLNTFTRTDTRVDGIFYGLLLAMLYHSFPATFQRMQSLRWVWITIVFVAIADFLFIPLRQWWTGPLSWVCADAMGVAVLLLLYKHRAGHVRPALYRLVAWIGLYSYGIYLWHVSFIVFVEDFAHKLSPRFQIALELTAPIVLGILVGILTTKLVEFPALKLRDRFFPRRVDSAVGVGSS